MIRLVNIHAPWAPGFLIGDTETDCATGFYLTPTFLPSVGNEFGAECIRATDMAIIKAAATSAAAMQARRGGGIA